MSAFREVRKLSWAQGAGVQIAPTGPKKHLRDVPCCRCPATVCSELHAGKRNSPPVIRHRRSIAITRSLYMPWPDREGMSASRSVVAMLVSRSNSNRCGVPKSLSRVVAADKLWSPCPRSPGQPRLQGRSRLQAPPRAFRQAARAQPLTHGLLVCARFGCCTRCGNSYITMVIIL